ncbi:MAG: MarR family transcriptional regulator [Candidatus Schekmanbacteria bacterium]|nr:MarR family transcriptional regulator [Candidatus Schekmanbacteria bacterium]
MKKNNNNGFRGKTERFEKAFRDFFSIIREKDRYRFSDFKVTEAQFIAMMFLREKKIATMSELKVWMGIHMSTLTGIIDRMVRDGFVKRGKDNTDRRIVNVSLTKKGSSTSSLLWKVRRERIETMLRMLNEDDQMLLIDTFERLSTNIKQKYQKTTEAKQ